MAFRTLSLFLGLCLLATVGGAATAQERADMEKVNAEIIKKREFSALLKCWTYPMIQRIDNKSLYTARFVVDLTRETWVDKVESLKEFGGSKGEGELQWSGLESKLLAALRKDVKVNPLFTDQKVYYKKRIEDFETRFEEGEELAAWQKELVSEMQRWVDAEVGRRVSPDMEREKILIGRADLLRSFLLDDISSAFTGRVPQEDMHRVYAGQEGIAARAYFAHEKLKSFDAFSFKEPLSPEQRKELSDLERLLYDYCWAAYPQNPVFDDLEHHRPRELTLWREKYLKYCEERRPPKEEAAYVALWNYLTIDLRKITGDPERVPRSRFNWRLWSGIASAVIIAATLAAGLGWRLRKRSTTAP